MIDDDIQPRRCDTILSGHVTRWYYARGVQRAPRMIHATKTWATRPNAQLRLLILLLCVISGAGGQAIVTPLDKEVALAGEIRRVHGYGPPGYGEDKKQDARITYWSLELVNPINVPCTPEKPEWVSDDCRATQELRLFFPSLPANNGLELKAKAMLGHKVIVTGILRRSIQLAR